MRARFRLSPSSMSSCPLHVVHTTRRVLPTTRARARTRQAIASVRLTPVARYPLHTAGGDARGLCFLLRRWQRWCSRARSPNIELHAQGSCLARQSGACEPRMPPIPCSGGALVVLNIVCTRLRARTRQDRSPVVVEVSACADIFGAHSAALDSEVRTCAHVILPPPPVSHQCAPRPTCCTRAHQGLVYTWGLGSATGHGTLKPVLTPQRVVDLTAVRSLACGGSCTAALTHDHHLYTWGAWAGGRLGARVLANIHARKQHVCCSRC